MAEKQKAPKGHTQGAWIVEMGECNPLVIAQAPDGPICVADVLDDCYPPTSEQDANARLIAGAPDLLSACNLFLDYCAENCQTGVITFDQVQAAVREAVAKATEK